MRNKEIRNIVIAALFASIASILKIYSLQITPTWRISIFAIPLLLGGYFLGPYYGLLIGFVTDTVYMFISPYASVWSIYTLSTMIWGFSGFLIKKLNWGLFGIILVISFTSISETLINSVAMYFDSRDIFAVLAGLPTRLTALVLRLPVLIIIFSFLKERLKQIELDLV